MKFPNKKGILVLIPTLLKFMSLFLNKFKLGFCSDTYLPFGPNSRFFLFFFLEVVPNIFQAVCDNSEIPYIETRPALTERHHHLSSINLHPDPDKLGEILVKLVSRFGWNQVILLYEDNFALRFLQPLLDVTATSRGHFQV